MKRNIVLEHRQALDAVERATLKYSGCRRRSACSDKAECLECPAYIERERCQSVLDEKSNVLKQLNEQIVVKNDAFALRQREDSLQKRMQREEKRGMRMQTPPKSHITVEQAERLQSKKEGLPVTMTPKSNKPVITPKYNRNELTAERYLAHKKNERLSDATILALYGIPKSTFEKWKRDNKITNKPIALYDAIAATEVISLQQKLDKLEVDYAKVQADCNAWQTSYSELEVKFNDAQRQSSESQDMSVTQQQTNDNATNDPHETDNRIVIEIDVLLAAYNTSHPSIEAALKAVNEEGDYKALYEQSCAKFEHAEKELYEYKLIANDNALALENYQKEIEALIHKRDEQDEETADAFNKQLTRFERYETDLLERILCLKKK